ncbi:hypothetical protein QQS21_006781 [Conoideocrella luteorostrata]|uniref:Uncharacterized protein n=1 Tax=Conoideocrella luteorostrata TaxID=1105319 RepID=A0AAJ0CRA6_9HYPO|nr:hypothetical protein QQS21_006781 [Conoideocrella luteorostrata]
MVCLALSTLALLLATTAVATASGSVANNNSTEANHDSNYQAYIFECESDRYTELLANVVEGKGCQVRHKFDSKVFRGLSMQLGNSTTSDNTVAEIKAMKGIRGMWPLKILKHHTIQDKVENQPVHKPKEEGWRGLDQRAADTAYQSRWTHLMTNVDKLHNKGFTGNGIKIAVVDSGVNYTHPALGGCFGKGCRVAFGDNFSSDGKKGDPMDCYDHGTEVAGILGGHSANDSFIGAAPNATLMAYRVLDCNGDGTEDSLIAGWLRAEKDGAQIIITSSGFQGENWAQRPLAMIASRISAGGVPCIGSLGNSQEKGLFYAMSPGSGDGVIAVNSFSSSYEISELSAHGPTWDLGIKPNVVVPGQGVPVTTKRGGYGFDSGTSFAGPLVAGIVALVAEARGGGLVDAWRAADATTLVEPASLAFNDTDHRAASISLKITNQAKYDMTYQLSNLTAATLYTLDGSAITPSEKEVRSTIEGEPNQSGAVIKLSRNSFTLGPGQSATVDVSAVEPSGLDSARLPLWSGWVVISGSDGSNLTVPYLGLSGSLRSAAVMGHDALSVRSFSYKNFKTIQKNSTFIFLDPVSGQKPGRPASMEMFTDDEDIYHGNVFLTLRLALASPQVRMDIDICPPENTTTQKVSPDVSMNCVPGSIVIDSYGIRSIGQIAGFPQYYVSRNKPIRGEWDGSFSKGRYVPLGRYKIVARALAIFGDANNVSHWQTIESPILSASYLHNYIDA